MSSSPKAAGTSSGGQNTCQQLVPSMYPTCFPPWPMMPTTTSGGPVATWPPPPFSAISPWVNPHMQGLQVQPKSQPDHYTVDSMRRIYSNEDASIEIERVKVQRRQQTVQMHPESPVLAFQYFPQHFPQMMGSTTGIFPGFEPVPVPIIRPPPRKHRKNQLSKQLVPSQAVVPTSFPQPGYPYPAPYFPCIPCPYPYPYPYFGYPALQTHSTPEPSTSVSVSDTKKIQNDSIQKRSLPAHPSTKRLESGTPRVVSDSISTNADRPVSPNAPSQVSVTNESLSTDIAPSDSVSMVGYKKGNDRKVQDMDKDSNWMLEMQKHLASIDALSEDGDRSSFTTAHSEAPTPPVRRQRFKKSLKQVSIDDISETTIDTSIPEKSSTNLKTAFVDLETSVDAFRTEVSSEVNVVPAALPPIDPKTKPEDEVGRSSSVVSYHSARNVPDVIDDMRDTTESLIATDGQLGGGEDGVSLAHNDEKDDHESSDCRQWVLLKQEEVPDVTSVWLTDVSVWRARLVVSLDRGQGLDQHDWATFHLLIQHPLPLHLKLSLLHAPRICAANTDIGAAQVRAALLQLARHAQVLLQREDLRPLGWRTIVAHGNQPWVPVKGGLEILRLLGFRQREDGILKYSRRLSLDASHLARLTLDLLLFADELRLYLTGGHLHPTNISDLFCPMTSLPASPQLLGLRMNPGPTSEHDSSTDMKSAETTPVLARKDNYEELNDLNAKEHSGKVSYNDQLIQRTSSEEEVTLHENDISKDIPNHEDKNEDATSKTDQRLSAASSHDGVSTVASDAVSISTDMASLPELQTASRTSSRVGNFENKPNFTAGSQTLPLKSDGDGIKESNPPRVKRDDHIYEEIGDIRAQVQKLRTSVSVPNLPPPLPPKTRSADGEGSSTYSRGGWSPASSFGGSTGRRRRKRRAPLPPSFMRNELKQDYSCSPDYKTQLESPAAVPREFRQSDRNPFYEEIGENRPKLPVVQENNDLEIIGGNPFLDSRPEPSGYVGANPFYEDVQQVKRNSSLSTSNTIFKTEPTEDSSTCTTNDGIHPVPNIQPKQIASPIPTSDGCGGREEILAQINPVGNQSNSVPQNGLDSKEMVGVVESELHDVDLNSTEDDAAQNISIGQIREENSKTSKNEEQKQLSGSQGVVSVDLVTESTDLSSQVKHSGLTSFSPEHKESKMLIRKTDGGAVDSERISSTAPASTKNQVSDERVGDSQIGNEGCLPLVSIDEVQKISQLPARKINQTKEGRLESFIENMNSEPAIVFTVEALSKSTPGVVTGKLNGNKDETNQEHVLVTDYCLKGIDEATEKNASQNARKTSASNLSIGLKSIDDIPYIDTNDVLRYKSEEEFNKTKLLTTLQRNQGSSKSNLKTSGEYFEKSESTNLNYPPLHSPPPPPPSTSPPESDYPESERVVLPYTRLDNVALDVLDQNHNPNSTEKNSIENTKSSEQCPGTSMTLDTVAQDSRDSSKQLNSQAENIDEKEQSGSSEDLELRSPIVFGSIRDKETKEVAISSGYYEIPEHPEKPPLLPAKPNNLRCGSSIQIAPEIPPKLSKLAINANIEKSAIEGNSKKISDVFSTNTLATVVTPSPKRTGKEPRKLPYVDGNTSPSKPPRRQKFATLSSAVPPRPPKNFDKSSSFTKIQKSKSNTLPASSRIPITSGRKPHHKSGRNSAAPSLSTPASPKPTVKPVISGLGQEAKFRKSWPFLLCECLYTHDSRDSLRSKPHF
ncbi:uncharacterized protein LOC108682269 [Hyalella azteca]|uniref:Uncharacterized protein LOC108682269 n=1 Tax=Hyalella azteca TaxID=294128 RepID=A0A8B7PN94_HYAAZ|nr:uncharacterized protein LOC108682269 [Hyalella azteca]